MGRPKSLFQVGELVVFNGAGNFGNKHDRLFQIHATRYGKCVNTEKNQFWYSGWLLEIREYASEGLPRVPFFSTSLTNAAEEQLLPLEKLRGKFNPYK
ncbi:TPA: hypothetical protein DEW47_01435 [Patescibacteria group bacterium]|nr:MAG: hypothetical protein UT83_C0010G0016 [Parcubacteria group bacterium GW2011_GWA2_40_143]HBB56656.1 hypothetical protein [Patescibacteria group bacterium]HCI04629.1 hypothetical protein [Patescibacteria group bacterium]